jgi:hypothetical protein
MSYIYFQKQEATMASRINYSGRAMHERYIIVYWGEPELNKERELSGKIETVAQT